MRIDPLDPHLNQQKGWLVLDDDGQTAWLWPDSETPGNKSVRLFATRDRAQTAAQLAGRPQATVVELSVHKLFQSFNSLIRDPKAAALLEMPGRLISLTDPAEGGTGDGFLEVDARTEKAFDDIQGRGFGERQASSLPQWESDDHPRQYAYATDNRLVSGLESQLYQTVWGSTVMAMESLGGVVAPLEARRQGKTRLLVQQVLAAMRERHTSISTITTPFSYPFYRRLGWEYAFSRLRHTFPPEILLGAPKRPGSLRHFRWNPETGAVPLDLAVIYELALKPTYQGYARRSIRQWATRVTGTLTDTYIWDGPQGPSGYMVVAVMPDHIGIKELVAVDDDSFLGLLRTMGSLDSQTDKIVWDALPDHAIDRWTAEPDRVTTSVIPQGMLRIVDVKQALEQRPYPASLTGALTVQVADDLCDWNNKTWLLEFRQGHLEVVQRSENDAGTAHMDIRTLALVFAGTFTATDAMRYHSAQLSPEQARLLDRAFASQTRPLLLEWF